VIEGLFTAFVLILARVGTFLTVVPVLGGAAIPRTVKMGLSLALAVLFISEDNGALAGDGHALTTWFGLSVALGREMILGMVLGFAMSLFLLPAHIAGEFISQEAGLSFANSVSATGSSTGSALAGLFETTASLIFFALDLHHVFLLVLQETFRMAPIGQGMRLPNWDLVMATGAAEEAGLLLAGPVALCLFLSTVVMIVMARVAPQLNLYSFGLPLRVLVCLIVLPLLLPQIVMGMIAYFSSFSGLLQLPR
jgi:flagellar biosynthetic protein FliR